MFSKINKNDVFKCSLFVLGFMLFLFIELSNNMLGYDKTWTFHMTQKIAMGEIPYSEINIIITPFFYQLGALIFNLLGRADYVSYAIYTALIGGTLTLLAYFIINEITKKEKLSFFATLSFLNILVTFTEPSYNTLLLVFIMLAIYLELRKEKKQNKTKYNVAIGVVLGLCAATKHTVGGIVLLTSIAISILKKYVVKEKCLREIIQKIVGIALVGIVYLIWLISVGALDEFIDLTILGMFDFAEKNTFGTFFNLISFINIVTIFSIFLLCYYIKETENRKECLIMRCICISNINIFDSNF